MAIKQYAQWLSGNPTDPPLQFEFYEETQVPLFNVGKWVEVVETDIAWDATPNDRWDNTIDPLQWINEIPLPSVRELKNAKRAELDLYVRLTVAPQGVDGPQSKGADSVLGPRAYPTDTFGRNQVNGTLQAIESRSGPMGDQAVFVLQTLRQHPSRQNGSPLEYGDYVGLGDAPINTGPYAPSTNNNSIYDLALALDTFDVALRNNLQVLAEAIEGVDEPPTQTYSSAKAELDAIDVTVGWPSPPVKP